MITFIVIILIIALIVYLGYKHQQKLVGFMRRFRLGRFLLSWFHSTVFDFKMENPDQVPKQVTAAFIIIMIIIGVVAILIAGNYQ